MNHTLNGALTAYWLDGDQMLEEKGPSGTVTYLWGNGLVRRGSEFPMTDAQGTTKLETNSSQSVTGMQETEAFGRTVGATGSTSLQYGYHGADGYRQDGEGPQGAEPYQKVGARYYDAQFGRFITRDTDLSQSPYAYCGGDPVNCSDPSGHLPIMGMPHPNSGPGGPSYDGSGSGDESGDGDSGDGEGLGGGPGGTDPGGSNPGGGPGAGSVSPSKPVVIPIGSGTTLTAAPSANGGIKLTLGNQNGGLVYTLGSNYNLTGAGGFGKIPLGGGFSFTFNGSVSLNSFKTNYGFGTAYSADF